MKPLRSGFAQVLWPALPAASALALGCVYLGYGADQQNFAGILAGYGLAFGAYAWILAHRPPPHQWYFWLGVAVLLRVVLWFGMPRLSDDVYRFVWDGRLALAGEHPYDHPPVWYYERGLEAVPGLDPGLYHQLNSQVYHTVYPPVAQAVFVAAVAVFPRSVYGSAWLMKFFLLLAELLALWLLVRLLDAWQLPAGRLWIYALNPLVMVEGMGNLHFEVSMVALLLLAIWWLVRQRWWLSAGAWALAVAAKLLPLMFLPLLWRRLGWRRAWGYYLAVGVALLVLFAPLLSHFFLAHLGDSLNLYFRQFEFNASVYYLARTIGYQVRGYNEIAVIGPLLALLTLLSIVGLALFERRPRLHTLPAASLLAITVYLLNTTTVHPWYLIMPVALAVFTPWRYAVWWSGLAVLSYAHYHGGRFQENFWWLAVEYGGVCLAIAYDLWQGRRRRRGAEPSLPGPE